MKISEMIRLVATVITGLEDTFSIGKFCQRCIIHFFFNHNNELSRTNKAQS